MDKKFEQAEIVNAWKIKIIIFVRIRQLLYFSSLKQFLTKETYFQVCTTHERQKYKK